jgi:hypothetical protein
MIEYEWNAMQYEHSKNYPVFSSLVSLNQSSREVKSESTLVLVLTLPYLQ